MRSAVRVDHEQMNGVGPHIENPKSHATSLSAKVHEAVGHDTAVPGGGEGSRPDPGVRCPDE
jgi:hypothetical protein